jgi:hypothetical protein
MPPGSIVFIVLLFGGALLNLLSIIMLSVVTLSVVMLSVIMLNVVVPKNLFNQTPTRVDVTKKCAGRHCQCGKISWSVFCSWHVFSGKSTISEAYL